MPFDPTKESYTTEERALVGDVPCTVRVTVQGGEVVAFGATVDQGYSLKASAMKDVSFDKVTRRAVKEAPADASEKKE